MQDSNIWPHGAPKKLAPIEFKLGTTDYIYHVNPHAKIDGHQRKGMTHGMGEVVKSCAF